MGTNLITLFMGSQYLVTGQETQGLRFDIGDANPSTILERMMNNHLSTIVEFFKNAEPFRSDLAYRKLGNVLFLNIARYGSKTRDYVVYLPHQLDKEQRLHIKNIVLENSSSKYTVLYNLKLDENSIPVGDTKSDITSDEFLRMI